MCQIEARLVSAGELTVAVSPHDIEQVYNMLEPAGEKEGRFSRKANSGSGSSEDGES